MPRLLTEREVIEVRSTYLDGNHSMSELADEYGLTKAGMQVVLDCTNWRELLAPGEAERLRRVRESRQPQLRRRRDYNGRRS
jgi:hypothetical protein